MHSALASAGAAMLQNLVAITSTCFSSIALSPRY
jgi:hypothetical protein